MSESWIRRLRQRRRESDEVAPRKSGHAVELKWLAHRERLETLVREQPDVTLAELRERLASQNIRNPARMTAMLAPGFPD